MAGEGQVGFHVGAAPLSAAFQDEWDRAFGAGSESSSSRRRAQRPDFATAPNVADRAATVVGARLVRRERVRDDHAMVHSVERIGARRAWSEAVIDSGD